MPRCDRIPVMLNLLTTVDFRSARHPPIGNSSFQADPNSLHEQTATLLRNRKRMQNRVGEGALKRNLLPENQKLLA
jgi:hypothetical protein